MGNPICGTGAGTNGEHPEKPISLFYSCSHRDEMLHGELKAHLSFLRRSKLVRPVASTIADQYKRWNQYTRAAGYRLDRQLEFKTMPVPQHLRVFISSPGDVADERNLARRLLKDELPCDPFLRSKVTLDPVSWDDPAF